MAVKESERQITIDDLKRVDIEKLKAEIQELEGQLELHTRQANEEIAKRKMFLRVVDVLQNGKKPRKAREMKMKPAARAAEPRAAEIPSPGRGRPSLADRIQNSIMARGPMLKSEICREVSASDDRVSFELQNDPRFIMANGGKWQVVSG